MNIKKYLSKKRKKGFSLIEMVAVISILAVLALIVVPNITSYTKKSEISKNISNARLIESSVNTYFAMNRDFPRLDDTPYTKAQVEAYAEKIYSSSGDEVQLDPSGKYYDINYDEMSNYLNPPEAMDKPKFILQNPVGKVFYLDGISDSGMERADFGDSENGDGSGGGSNPGNEDPEDPSDPGETGEPSDPGDSGETGDPDDGTGGGSSSGYTQEQIDELVSQGYIEVSTIEDLNNVRNNLSGKYIQINDINLSSVANFVPIGTQSNSFSGIYNGGDYTISNLTITSTGQDYKGLFATLTTGSHILNLNMTNVKMNVRSYAGVIAGDTKVSGYGAQGAKLENINISGTVSGASYIGGIAGRTQTATLTNVHFNGLIKTTSTTLGGLVGQASDLSKIVDSSFRGTIEGKERTGGLVGYLLNGPSSNTGSIIENSNSSGALTGVNNTGGLVGVSNTSFIKNSYSTMNVKGAQYVGGLVGDFNRGSIENSYATGTLYGTHFLGGLVGRVNSGTLKNSYSAKTLAAGSKTTAGVYNVDSYGTFTNVYFDRTLDNTATGAKTPLHARTTVQMQTQSNYATWDFSGVWEMGSNGYPKLR